MSEKKTSKTGKILAHLRNKGSITSFEAIELYGATRLSSIIHSFREKGMNIETVDVPFVDRFGVKSHCARYVLHEER